MFIATIVNKHNQTEDVKIKTSDWDTAYRRVQRRMKLIGAKELLQLVNKRDV